MREQRAKEPPRPPAQSRHEVVKDKLRHVGGGAAVTGNALSGYEATELVEGSGASRQVGYEQPVFYRRDETSDEVHLDTAVILWIHQWL